MRPPSVICYHRVLPDFTMDRSAVESYHHERSMLHSLAVFRAHLDALQSRCSLVDAGQYIECLEGRRLSKPPVLLTFDDGYADFMTVVLPELSARGLPCALFPTMAPVVERFVPPADQVYSLLAEDYAGQRCLDDETRKSWVGGSHKKSMLEASPEVQAAMISGLAASLGLRPPQAGPAHLTEKDIAGLPDSVYVGAHGLYHHEFGSLGDRRLSEELTRILGWIKGLRPGQAHGAWLAYPNGKANRPDRPNAVTDVVRAAGVDYAFVASARPGLDDKDQLEIPRLFSHDDLARFNHCWSA